MPIAQSRMLALIAAAEDYEQAWIKVRNAYNNIAENINAGILTIEQAWPELDFMFTSQLFLSDPEGTLKTIARESAHFKATSKRNQKSAQWQREKRNGRQPRTPAEVKARVQQAHLARALKITNTDEAQVNSDSDLEFEPSEPSPEGKAAAFQYLADLEAKAQYETVYPDNPAKPANIDKL